MPIWFQNLIQWGLQMYFLVWSKKRSDNTGNLAPPHHRSGPAPRLFWLPLKGQDSSTLRTKASMELPVQIGGSGDLVSCLCNIRGNSECLAQIRLALNSNASFGLYFYAPIGYLSFIPPFKVEYLNFCFDYLTNFPILAEYLPMSKEALWVK